MSGQRRALVVAIDRYTHPMLRKLAAPTADAAALARVLGEPDLGGFEVEVLTDANSYEVTQAVEGLLGEAKSSDLVLLHFSCHGIKDDTGELFLAATNTVPNRLVSTAVEAALVSRLIQRSRAQRVVLLLDCCYGGAFERGVIARAGDQVDVAAQFTQQQGLGGGRGRAIITASAAMEYAFEGTTLTDTSGPSPSLFTGALVEGITSGEADRDQDGQVGLDELYDYIHTKVQERTPNQTPSKWEFGIQGDLYIARNPHRKIQPVKLPDELSELVAHPAASVRLAAVGDLDQLAGGHNLGLAAGARLALEELAADDSRRVSVAAINALDRTAVGIIPSQVDWGQGPAGSSPRVEVRIEGGPLAEASSIEVTHEHLQARIADSVMTVTTTSDAPVPPAGQVSLTGPAGEATLRITGITGSVADTSDRADQTLGAEPEAAALVDEDNDESATDEYDARDLAEKDDAKDLGEIEGDGKAAPVADELDAVGSGADDPDGAATAASDVDHKETQAVEPQQARRPPKSALVAALAVLLLGAIVVAVLVSRSSDQGPQASPPGTGPATGSSQSTGTPETVPTPFQSAAQYDFARYLFDVNADKCYVPDESDTPLVYQLDKLPVQLVKCESSNAPYSGVFWCTSDGQELLDDRRVYLDQAVPVTERQVTEPPAGQDVPVDGVQRAFLHIDKKGARVYWDSPAQLCAAELQARYGDNNLDAALDYWLNGRSS
jgi:Caspase domain